MESGPGERLGELDLAQTTAEHLREFVARLWVRPHPADPSTSQIRLRKVDGHHAVAGLLADADEAAA